MSLEAVAFGTGVSSGWEGERGVGGCVEDQRWEVGCALEAKM